MAEKFQNKYRIPSNRLQGFDYGSDGAYFVTICTKNRLCYFGNIVETGHCPSQSNDAEADIYPSKNESRNPGEADNYPSKNNTDNRQIETGHCPSLRPTKIGQIAIDFWNDIPNHYPFVILDEFVVMPNHIHGILFFNKPDKTDWQPNQFGPQSQNLGAVIRAYKSSVKRYANQNNIEFEWQSRFHDHIIRDVHALNNIRQYIITNPKNWSLDALNMNADVETGDCPSENIPNNPVETDNYPSLPTTIENELNDLMNDQ